MLSVFSLVLAFISLLVAGYATYSSNKLAINNSALNFIYENINIEGMDPAEGIKVSVKDIGVQSQGGFKLYIDTKVISGQIESLYLVQKQNDEFIFTLLNNEGIQDKFSGIKKYNAEIFLEMEKKRTLKAYISECRNYIFCQWI